MIFVGWQAKEALEAEIYWSLVKSLMPPIDLSSVPRHDLLSGLKELPQWICWYSKIDSDGKLRKKPYPHDDSCTLYKPGIAKYSSRDNWLSYTKAREVQSKADIPLGIGFVLTERDELAVLDIDDCVDPESGEVCEEVLTFIKKSESYTEISPSGTGLHIIVKGHIPRQGWSNQPDGFKLEVYDKFFITVTMKHLDDTPTSVKPAQDFLRWIFEEYDISWPDPKFGSFWPDE